jgi:hypothetical protein
MIRPTYHDAPLALKQKPNLTTDNTDNTDLHGPKKFNQDHF